MSRPAPQAQERRLYVEGGGYYTVPDWATDDDIKAFRTQHPEILPDPTTLGSVAEGVARGVRAVPGALLGMGIGATGLLPGDTGARDVLQRGQQWLRKKDDPRYDESFIAGTGQAVGSTLPYIAGGVAGLGTKGLAGLGALAGAGEQTSRMDVAEEGGEYVSDFERLMSNTLGAAIGTTEAIPVGRLTGKVLPEAIQAGASRATKKVSQNWVGSAIRQGIEEGTQEFGAGVAQNIAAQIYEDSAILPDTRDFTLGFAAGALLDMATRGAGAGFGSMARARGLVAEGAARDGPIAAMAKPATKEVRRVEREAEEAGVEITPAVFDRPLDFVEQDDGTYVVVNTATGEQLSPAVQTQEEAASLMGGMAEADLTNAVMSGVLMKLDAVGRGHDPFDIQLGLTASHPQFTTVPTRLVASWLTRDVAGAGEILDARSKRARDAIAANPALKALEDSGRSHLTMEEARGRLGAQADGFFDQLAQMSATQLADLNRDVAAHLNKSGIPKLRARGRSEVSTDFIEQMNLATTRQLRGEAAELPRVTALEIANEFRARGYKVDGKLEGSRVRSLVKQWTGTTNVGPMANKRLILARVLALPVRKGGPEKGYTIPDFSPLPYTAAQRKEFLDILAEAGGPVSVNTMSEKLNMEPVPYKRMVADVRESGRVKREKGSWIAATPEEVRFNQNLKEGEELIRETVSTDGRSEKLMAEALKVARVNQSESEGRSIEEINEELGSPEEGGEYVVEVDSRLTQIAEWMGEKFRSMGLSMNADGVSVQVAFETQLKKIAEATGHYVAGNKVPAAFVDSVTGPARILLDHTAVDPTGEMTAEELYQALVPSIDYEFMRWLRNYDYFKSQEWRALKRAVNTVGVPENVDPSAAEAGMTWYEMAEAQLENPTGLGAKEQIFETAISMMFQAHQQGLITSDKKRGFAGAALKRLGDHVRDMVGVSSDLNMGPALSIFKEVNTGEIGGRDPGKSILNPEGDVRSMLMTDRDLVRAERAKFEQASEEAGAQVVENVPAPGPMVSDEVGDQIRREAERRVANQIDRRAQERAYEGADKRSQGERRGDPAIDLRRLEAQALAQRAAEERAAAPPGVEPRVGAKPSMDALNVYYASAEDPMKMGIPQNIRFKYGWGINQANSDLPKGLKDPVNYDTSKDDRTFYERVSDAMAERGLLAALDEAFPQTFEDFRHEFREGFLDQRVKVRKVSKKAVEKEWNDRGVLRLADWHSERAITMLDKSSGVNNANMRLGVPRYQEGLVKHEAIRVEGIGEIKGFYDALMLLKKTTGGKNTYYDKAAHKYMIARRAQYLWDDAQAAKAKLKSKRPSLSKKEIRDLNATIKKGEVLPGGMKPKDFNGIVKHFETASDMQPVRDFAAAADAYNRAMVQFMADTGLISQEQAQEWQAKAYLPYYRVNKDTDPFFRIFKKKKDNASRINAAEIGLEGMALPLDVDLMTAMVANIERITRDGLANAAFFKVARDVVAIGEGYVMTEEELGKSGAKTGAIRYLVDGVEEWVLPDDIQLAAAVMAVNQDFYSGVHAMAVAPARFLRELITRSPGFLVRNVFKDAGHTAVATGADVTPLKGQLEQMNGDTMRLAESLNIAITPDFLNTYSGDTRKQIVRQMELASDTPKVLAKIWNKLGDVSRGSDALSRMAVFKYVLEKTGNEAEAAWQAEEIINYTRRGNNPYWRMATATIPFLNARMQGMDVLYRAFKGEYTANPELAGNPREIQKRVMAKGLFLAGITAGYFLLAHDEDWYKNTRDEIKDDYWLIPLPDGESVIHLPVPFEVGLIFKTIPEQALRAVFEEGYAPKDAAEGFQRAFTQATMFQPVPQVVAPLIDVVNNRDSYTGREIIPGYMKEGARPEDQRDLNTSEMAVLLGEALNVSPKQIEYVINGYMGPAGLYAMMVGDKIARTEVARAPVDALPWVDLQSVPTPSEEVTGDGIYDMLMAGAGTGQDLAQVRWVPMLSTILRKSGGGHQESFYELRQEVDRAVAAVNKARREGRYEDSRAALQTYQSLLNIRGTVLGLDRYMTRWRERRDRVLMSSDLTPSEKRERVRIMEEERDLQLSIVPMLREAARSNQTGR